MSPTPKALDLIEPIRQAIDQVGQVLAPAGPFDPRTCKARLTVTATDYVEFVLMPHLVQSLEKQAPGVELEIRVANRQMASQWLSRGEIDFRIGWVRRPPGELRFKKLYTPRHEDRILPGRIGNRAAFFAGRRSSAGASSGG